jgi:SET domain-containing protein
MSLPAILLVALRAIEAGEEITYDYAATMHDDPWEMKCNCGALECRGTIRTSSEPRQSTKR